MRGGGGGGSGGHLLLRAGLCLRMPSGTSAIASLLKRSLQPHGLGGAALGFDANSMARSFQRAADGLLDRFVELQAQALSLELRLPRRRRHAAASRRRRAR